jgi:hypothetical protein
MVKKAALYPPACPTRVKKSRLVIPINHNLPYQKRVAYPQTVSGRYCGVDLRRVEGRRAELAGFDKCHFSSILSNSASIRKAAMLMITLEKRKSIIFQAQAIDVS